MWLCAKLFLPKLILIHNGDGYGTNIEGEWDEVMAALKRCHEKIHAMGSPRISTSIRLGTRTDREQTIADKIDSVNSILIE